MLLTTLQAKRDKNISSAEFNKMLQDMENYPKLREEIRR